VRKLAQRVVSHIERITIPKSLGFVFRRVTRWHRMRGAGHRFTILVIKLDLIGDVILSVPALRELRRSFPESRILLVVQPQAKQLVDACPYVDRVMPFDPAGPRLLRPFAWTVRLARVGWALAKERVDSAIVLRWDVDSIGCGVAYVSGASVRAGYSESVNPDKAKANRGNDRLLTKVLNNRRPEHEVISALSLIGRVGAVTGSTDLELWLTEQDRSKAEALLSQMTANSGAVVAVGIGASECKRQWPITRYRAVCKTLKDSGFRLVMLGSVRDAEAARFVADELGEGVINLAGCTSLRETAAILARCRLIVGNDSGLVHMAAAVSVPSVVISCHPRNGDPLHPNSPHRFAPWGVRNVVLQPLSATPPCEGGCDANDAHCILAIEPHKVVAATRRLLGGAQGSPPSAEPESLPVEYSANPNRKGLANW